MLIGTSTVVDSDEELNNVKLDKVTIVYSGTILCMYVCVYVLYVCVAANIETSISKRRHGDCWQLIQDQRRGRCHGSYLYVCMYWSVYVSMYVYAYLLISHVLLIIIFCIYVCISEDSF